MELAKLNEAVCHCGSISIRLSEKPTQVYECSCSICRRLGVLWAYYHCDDVAIENDAGSTEVYAWKDKVLEFHRCARCGCTTHWIASDPNFRERMGINARLIDGLNRQNTELGYVDHGDTGQFWSRETDG